MIKVDKAGRPVGGSLAGKQWQPRDIAAAMYATGPLWQDALVLQEGVQVCLAESQGYERAYNDNLGPLGDVPVGGKVRDAEGFALYEVVTQGPAGVTVKVNGGATETLPPDMPVVLSRDVGIMEINIPAEQIGGTQEGLLYDAQTNFEAAYQLYSNRKWQPWAAWNSQIYNRDTYVKRAARGVGNWLAHYALVQPADPDAIPRYLTDPVLDFSYRLAGCLHYLNKARSDLYGLKVLLTSPANQAKVDAIVSGDIGPGLGFKTADHPWDFQTP